MRVGPALACLLPLATACSAGPQLIVCDQAEARIAILAAESDWSEPEAVQWEWRARETASLAAAEREWFENPTEAKPVLGGEYLLVTASGGGVALVRVEDGGLLFHAYAGGNPHSAELLFDGGLVVACSTGNELQFWRLEQPDGPIQRLPCEDAHGVAWDPHTTRLWALGRTELLALSYLGKDEDQPLRVVERYPLPDPGGHDLSRMGSGALALSTHGGGWIFDPRQPQFLPYPGLAEVADLKSISEPIRLRGNLPTVTVRAEESWWSETVRAVGRDWSRSLPGSRIYKSRWMLESQRPRSQPRFSIGIGFSTWLGADPD
ncbi:MAG: hypothetical protein CMJ94_04775 [Planctomycetes bacterium]|nr:hypothetical protein [Planctomycetota bacterium]